MHCHRNCPNSRPTSTACWCNSQQARLRRRPAIFALFTGQSPQCGPLNLPTGPADAQPISTSTMSDLRAAQERQQQRSDEVAPTRGPSAQLAQADCGPQYRAAAAVHERARRFSRRAPRRQIFSIRAATARRPAPSAPSAYAPATAIISRFRTRRCRAVSPTTRTPVNGSAPAREAALYTYRNPGEDINQAVSVSGQPYTALPNAFVYRRQFTAACSCRHPGQSWADALKIPTFLDALRSRAISW